MYRVCTELYYQKRGESPFDALLAARLDAEKRNAESGDEYRVMVELHGEHRGRLVVRNERGSDQYGPVIQEQTTARSIW